MTVLRTCLLAGLTLLLLCPALASAETRIMTVTDTHFLAPELYEGSELLASTMTRSDGKVSFLSRELADALVAEALRVKPDALVLTGDLTFNGEYASHAWLAGRLRNVQQAGIQVYVTPGNHDLINPNARDWSGGQLARTANTTPEQFQAIWGDMMRGDPAPEGCGLSYVAHVTDKVWLLMLDVCVYDGEPQTFGLFTKDQLAWVNTVLDEAQAQGVQVISATHHNMLVHTSYQTSSYTIWGGDALAKALRSHGMKLNLSGHMHIQHIVEQDGVADCATGSFSVSPHTWALVTVGEDGSVAYQAQGLDADCLPAGMAEETAAFFHDLLMRQEQRTLEPLGLPEEQIAAIADFSATMTQSYFAGTVTPEKAAAWTTDELYTLWPQLAPEDRHLNFLPELLATAERDMQVEELP